MDTRRVGRHLHALSTYMLNPVEGTAEDDAPERTDDTQLRLDTHLLQTEQVAQ